MLRVRCANIVFLLLMATNLAFADTFDAGLASFEVNDYEEAYDLWIEAAKEGDVDAQYYLGLLSSNGWGTRKSEMDASKWYRKAAEQNHAGAQYILARAFLTGKGVGEDPIEAFRWFLRSAENSNTRSQYNLGKMYYNGNGVRQNYEKAYMWYRRAADRNHLNSIVNLANMYLNGKGVKKNIDIAIKHFKMASDGGDYLAKKLLKSVKKRKECYKNSMTEIFDIPVRCAGRSEFRSILHSAGLQTTSENIRDRYDRYKAENGLDGRPANLSIGYTTKHNFAHAKYEFPNAGNNVNPFPNEQKSDRVKKILHIIEKKYGPPKTSIGILGQSAVEYTWELQDKIILELKQNAPRMSAYLEYKHPQFYKQIQ